MMNQSTTGQPAVGSTVNHAVVVPSRVRVGPRTIDSRETKVQLNKNGTTIESIHITCACGEEIVINCLYKDAA